MPATWPDCVFVEDTAIVLDEVAVMMSMGAASRRDEVPAIEAALREYRTIERVTLPATIDGGDVVRAGATSSSGCRRGRTPPASTRCATSLAPFGYSVTAVPVLGCLHLKSACSALPDGRFLVNSNLDRRLADSPAASSLSRSGRRTVAGDVLVIGERIIASDAFPETISLLGSRGWDVIPVSVIEFAKAEGGVTCMSLVFNAGLD